MKIIISKTFEKDFKKFIWKNYTICNLIKIVSIIYKFTIVKWDYLNRPFMKLKFDFCNKAIRLLIFYDLNNEIIIPIFITDKNDKKYWYNMTRTNISKIADKNFENIEKDIEKDIEKWDFSEF